MQHLIDIASLDRDIIRRLFDRADAMQKNLMHGSVPNSSDQPLRGQTVVNLFYENSTRTRVSLELAAKRLGADVVNVMAKTSSASKGETLVDTFHNLCAMGCRLFNLRHPQVGAPQRLAECSPPGVHIINAGDGVHAHPTQALLDIYTLQQHLGDLQDKRIVIVGDLRHSRVARSDIALLALLGVADIRLAAPEGLQMEPLPAGNTTAYNHLDNALQDADAVIMLRVQKERMEELDIPDDATYHRAWGLTGKRLELCRPDVKILHPGPVNRGVEISDEVLDGSHSLVLEQVRLGMLVRMAVMQEMFVKNTLEC